MQRGSQDVVDSSADRMCVDIPGKDRELEGFLRMVMVDLILKMQYLPLHVLALLRQIPRYLYADNETSCPNTFSS